ncbi:hypothetical protein ACR79P_19785 [Sphingobacterium spiritivorum]|uniref:P-loop NTPase n=1 Tax=Sphingobacterium spiritivorum TaxID=258 RepID=UPI003DA4FF23
MKKQNNQNTLALKQVRERLEGILQKRTGGAVNFRGMHFQVLYACHTVLKELTDVSSQKSLVLEGIEDLDVHSSPTVSTGTEYVQLKSSENKMDAGTFWTLGVLQNFLEVHRIDPEKKFRIIYNMTLAKGNLTELVNRKIGQSLNGYWMEKFGTLDPRFDPVQFMDSIIFEHRSVDGLYNEILIMLYKDWTVNKGTEMQFLSSLFYHVLIWSKDRAGITAVDVHRVFGEVRDSFSKAPVNEAIRHNWIEGISFRSDGADTGDYFDGKAARPDHIAMGIPARRRIWEKRIQEAISVSDVTLIRSSSGQGKSTLAWQVSHNLLHCYTVYQIHACRNVESANAIVEFLDTRIIIGEMPLVIIDGLSIAVEAWHEVVQRTADQTIKYLITSREEDWFRFGAEVSRINLAEVEISLSMAEAKDIFEQFQKRGKISPGITQWQPVWEQVHVKGLLIEYTFLLTKGEMIRDRLTAQLKQLNNDIRSSSAKIEILRMVSLADCLNITLETSRLLSDIQSRIGFDQDRGMVLDELEKEYFLKFNERNIEGLHPVRSQHLKDLLHRNLSVEESLINLMEIVDEEYKPDFFVNAPLLVSPENKDAFYKSLAGYVSGKEFNDMILAFDGIMHGEPQRYWLENKSLFDEAFEAGGIKLFCMTTVPFAKLDTLNEMSEILHERGEIFRKLAGLKEKLPAYSFENSDVMVFAKALAVKLEERTDSVKSYDRLEFLVKWFTELEIPFRFPFIQNNIDVSGLFRINAREARERIALFSLTDPYGYRRFVEEHRAEIISYLKVATDSPSVSEKGEDIYIQYILLHSDADKANEMSVSRTEIFHSFLPGYKTYYVEGIVLPFPSEQFVSFMQQCSIKHLTPEVIGNNFDPHRNKLWLSVIQRNYQETSAYEWQKNFLGLRRIIIEWAKGLVRFTESLLEGNLKKKKESANSLAALRIRINSEVSLSKAYPKYGGSDFNKLGISEEEKTIEKWQTSVLTFNGQLLNIYDPGEEQERRLAMINLKKVYLGLPIMQDAFRIIESKTIAYFDSEIECSEESVWFERLYTTILYYLSEIPLENKPGVKVARISVSEWWAIHKNAALDRLNNELNDIAELWGHTFYLPESLHETDTLTYATFGIADFDFADPEANKRLSFDLIGLADLPIDFYTIVTVKDGIATGGMRFQRGYFEAVEKILDGDEDVDLENVRPLDVFPDKDTIKAIPGIELYEQSAFDRQKEIMVNVLFELWRLSEYRMRLDPESKIELEGLEMLESEIGKGIKNKMRTLTAPSPEFSTFVKAGLNRGTIYSQQDIVEYMNETLKLS